MQSFHIRTPSQRRTFLFIYERIDTDFAQTHSTFRSMTGESRQWRESAIQSGKEQDPPFSFDFAYRRL